MTTVAKGQPIELTSPSLHMADMEVDASSSSVEQEGDLYTRLKTLQRQLEFYEIQVVSAYPVDLHQTERAIYLYHKQSLVTQAPHILATVVGAKWFSPA